MDLVDVGEDFEIFDVFINLEDNIASEDSSFVSVSQSKKRVQSVYSLIQTFKDKEAALVHLKFEDTWNKDRLNETNEGFNEIYVFKHYPVCSKKCYLLFNYDSTNVSLWVKDQDLENHHEIGQKFGINLITKNEIDKMHAN